MNISFLYPKKWSRTVKTHEIELLLTNRMILSCAHRKVN